jgi:hypothetical protein
MEQATSTRVEKFQVTAKQVKDTLLEKASKIEGNSQIQVQIPWRKCGFCGTTIGYLVIDNALYFDPNCDCTSYRGLNPISWEDLAQSVNIQSTDEICRGMAARLGIDTGVDPLPVT